MTYKMIVTDLDDTLLNANGEISEVDKANILACEEKGVKFVLASGRPTFAMKHLASALKLDLYKSYMLSFNGAIVTECETGKTLFEESLSCDDIHTLYDFSKQHKVDIITYLDDQIISETESEYIDVELEITKMPLKIVSNFKKYVTRSAVKCIMLASPEYLKRVEKILQTELGSAYSISLSKPFFLEITKKGIDKGATLEKLMAQLNIKRHEVIAVGDSYNDITMLQASGLPIAVSNAKLEVKAIAEYIARSNIDGGMSDVIEKFIFKKTL